MRSKIGDVIAAERSPTTMRIAPEMPAWSEVKAYGYRIWFRREEKALKKPTYTLTIDISAYSTKE